MKDNSIAKCVETLRIQQLSVPNFEIIREIGIGANGTVFEAHDIRLDRRVALKIWNSAGSPRAQAEIRKIAGVNHPLVVSTYLFGAVDDLPYAVMELVPGVSGKQWMRSEPSVDCRVKIWRMYARALRHLYASKLVHGDPHLGNLIVYDDRAEAVDQRGRLGKPSVAMKLADTGTSEIWGDDGSFEAREARLIRETAKRLLKTERFGALADGLDSLEYPEMLAACDAVVSCISTLNGMADSDAYSLVAGAVVKIAVNTPVFDLDELRRQALESRMTQVHRVVTRLNGALQGRSEQHWWEGEEEIASETRHLYAQLREDWRSRRA